MIVSCILRKSVAFRPEHVYWLGKQVGTYLPMATFLPFSDTPLDIPHERLKTTWPSWWAKMEAYARLPKGPVLMLDIDTVIVKPWEGLDVPEGKAYMPTFPNRTDKVLGAWQLSSPGFRKKVVEHFHANPEGIVDSCGGCDQEYYRKHWMQDLLSLRSVAPDLCTSYKLQAKPHGLFKNTAFVIFHGLPRPWEIEAPWIPSLKET